MPTLEEMKNAVTLIRKHCASSAGKHAEILSELAFRLDPHELENAPKEQLYNIVQQQYFDAISILLMLAAPPSAETLDKTLKRIGEQVEEPVSGIQILDINSRENVEIYNLRDSLPKKRRLSKRDRQILKEFQDQLPASDWGKWIKQGDE